MYLITLNVHLSSLLRSESSALTQVVVTLSVLVDTRTGGAVLTHAHSLAVTTVLLSAVLGSVLLTRQLSPHVPSVPDVAALLDVAHVAPLVGQLGAGVEEELVRAGPGEADTLGVVDAGGGRQGRGGVGLTLDGATQGVGGRHLPGVL